MSVIRIKEIIDDCDFNVTFSGGDPLMQPINEMVELARLLKADGRTIWCYTGYSYEYVASRSEYKELLACIDVLVDGPFVESLRDISLRFRGSGDLYRYLERYKSGIYPGKRNIGDAYRTRQHHRRCGSDREKR